MTQELYQRAMKFAGEKHSAQTVPGTTANYLLHISNVAMEILVAWAHSKDFDFDFAVQTAILHDTLEDTDTTYEELETIFGKRIADAVQALTKNDHLPDKSQKMADSLFRISQLEKEVALVKMADRITNLQTPPAHWTGEKINSYREEAQLITEGLSHVRGYLHTRLMRKILEYDA